MSTNNIKDVKTVDSENFDYLLAESNFRIESVFRSRNKAEIQANVPMTTKEITTNNAADWIADNSKTKTGGTFDFVIDANDYSLFDLRDGVFDVQGQFYYDDQGIDVVNTSNYVWNKPVFGNQCLFSLFQNMELYIDDVLIQRNAYPGFSSNAEFALRYPHTTKEEKTLEINGWVVNDKSKYDLVGITTGGTAEPLSTSAKTLNDYDVSGINISLIQISAADGTHPAVVKVIGNIHQRIRIADMFSVVETLPPIYNHKITIRLQRSSHNYICCNTATYTGSMCNFIGFQKFKLFQDTYITTDQYISTAKKYYSKPIETLITQDKQLLVPLITTPAKSQTQSFNLNVDAAYKNKLLTICIPRTTNFTGQRNAINQYFSATAGSEGMTVGVSNDTNVRHYDILKAPANSYTFGGLRQLQIQTTSGLMLYNFDMENDGIIQGNINCFCITNPSTQQNVHTTDIYMANYQNVYEQYKKARLHFQQLEDEALDYETFIKEYCVYCIDLSCFQLSPNENIRITMTTSDWGTQYNPFFAYNSETETYTNSVLICNLFCDKVLRLLPNRRVELADMITANTSEVDNSNMA